MNRKVAAWLLTVAMAAQSWGIALPVQAAEIASGEALVESTAEESGDVQTESQEAESLDSETSGESSQSAESEKATESEETESEMETEAESQTEAESEVIWDTEPEAPVSEPDAAYVWGEGQLGNTPAAILGGGRLAESPDGGSYFSEEGSGTIQYRDGEGNNTVAVAEEGHSLHVFSDAVYYVTGAGTVRKYQPSTGTITTVLQWEKEISQLYVVDETGMYFLSEGNLYGGALGQEMTCVREDGSIAGFIPTREGMLYAKGTALDWEIWAGDTWVASQVSNWDCQDGYLILTIDGEDYQKSVSDLFQGLRSASQLETYQLGETHSVEELLNHDEECEVCAANGELVAEGLVEVEAVPEELASAAAVTAYASVSSGQQNIVKRAKQQYQIQWTPLEDIAGWNRQYTFTAGTTYQGLPYGQPVYGRFIPFESDNSTPSVAALQVFLDAVNDLGSRMYTSVSTYNKVAPYYSSDCSSFVSYAWGLYRHTTSSLPGECTRVSNQSVYSVQVGDIFNKAGSHTVLVADVGYDSNGTVSYVDILEQTPPKVKRTRYGANGEKSLADLHDTYLDSGYTLYRYIERDSVSYTHSCASPVDQDYCSSCRSQLYFAENDVWVMEGESVRLSVTNTTGQTVTWKSMDTSIATVSSSGLVTGVSGSETDAYGHTMNVVIQATAGGQSAVCTVHVIRNTTDREAVDGFVERLYRLVLGRTPREDEVEFWSDILWSHEMTGAEVAAGFVFSAEYQNKNVSHSQFVQTMYQTLMDRTAHTDEVAFWQEYLDAGFTKDFVFEGFANSVEFGNICERYGIERGSYSNRGYVDNHEQITFFVARLYQTCLGRNPKTAEAEDWVRRLVNGSFGGREVAYGFFFSREFQNKNCSNQEYVYRLYEAFLDRTPTSSEAQDWINRLNNGSSRSFVFDGFAYSVEFSRLCARYGIDVE